MLRLSAIVTARKRAPWRAVGHFLRAHVSSPQPAFFSSSFLGPTPVSGHPRHFVWTVCYTSWVRSFQWMARTCGMRDFRLSGPSFIPAFCLGRVLYSASFQKVSPFQKVASFAGQLVECETSCASANEGGYHGCLCLQVLCEKDIQNTFRVLFQKSKQES